MLNLGLNIYVFFSSFFCIYTACFSYKGFKNDYKVQKMYISICIHSLEQRNIFQKISESVWAYVACKYLKDCKEVSILSLHKKSLMVNFTCAESDWMCSVSLKKYARLCFNWKVLSRCALHKRCPYSELLWVDFSSETA